MTSREFRRICPAHRAIIEPFLAEMPVRLGAMAKALDLRVKLSALEPGESGLIRPEGDGYLIKINRYETRERQRFTLAHEIAHFLLHKELIDESGGIVDNILYRSGQPQQVEYEANRLAADLVMPEHLIMAELKRHSGGISEEVIGQIAEDLQVSKPAMEIRLKAA